MDQEWLSPLDLETDQELEESMQGLDMWEEAEKIDWNISNDSEADNNEDANNNMRDNVPLPDDDNLSEYPAESPSQVDISEVFRVKMEPESDDESLPENEFVEENQSEDEEYIYIEICPPEGDFSETGSPEHDSGADCPYFDEDTISAQDCPLEDNDLAQPGSPEIDSGAECPPEDKFAQPCLSAKDAGQVSPSENDLAENCPPERSAETNADCLQESSSTDDPAHCPPESNLTETPRDSFPPFPERNSAEWEYPENYPTESSSMESPADCQPEPERSTIETSTDCSPESHSIEKSTDHSEDRDRTSGEFSPESSSVENRTDCQLEDNSIETPTDCSPEHSSEDSADQPPENLVSNESPPMDTDAPEDPKDCSTETVPPVACPSQTQQVSLEENYECALYDCPHADCPPYECTFNESLPMPTLEIEPGVPYDKEFHHLVKLKIEPDRYYPCIKLKRVIVPGTATKSPEAVKPTRTSSRIAERKGNSVKNSQNRRGGRGRPRGPYKKEKVDTSALTCGTCGYVAPFKAYLIQHTRKHTGEKPYECRACGSAFTFRTNLIYHIEAHCHEAAPLHPELKVRNFKPRIPKKVRIPKAPKVSKPKPTQLQKLLQANKQRRKRLGTSIIDENTGEIINKRFECETCNRTFLHDKSLQYHRKGHTGVKPHKCTLCDRTFRKPSYRAIHMVNKHADDPEAQADPKFEYYKALVNRKYRQIRECQQSQKTPKPHRVRRSPQRDPKVPQEYLCETCGTVLKSWDALNRHKKTGVCQRVLSSIPQVVKVLKCTRCDLTFPDRAQRTKHELEAHGYKFVCTSCSAGFVDAGRFQFHRRNEHPQEPQIHVCEICAMEFTTLNCRKSHMRKAHKCQPIVSSPLSLNPFRRSSNAPSPRNAPKSVRCSICPEMFPTVQKQQSHEARHGNSFICDLCLMPVGFKHGLGLLYHKQRFHSIPFQRNSTGENSYRFRCRLCIEGFSKRLTLKRHKKTHGTNFFCAFCPAGFIKHSALTNHKRRVHSGAIRFKCTFCPSDFRTPADRQKHVETDHPALMQSGESSNAYNNIINLNPENSAPEGLKQLAATYKCDFCPLIFHLRHQKDRHVGGHGDKFMCPYCPSGFRAVNGLVLHKRQLHSDRPTTFCCKTCGRSFTSKVDRYRHLVDDHGKRRKRKPLSPLETTAGAETQNQEAVQAVNATPTAMDTDDTPGLISDSFEIVLENPNSMDFNANPNDSQDSANSDFSFRDPYCPAE